MAIQVLTEVWDHSTATGARLLVLLAIADRARPEDATAWPGVRDVATRARVTERQAQRHIASLIASGELRRVHLGGRGPRSTSTYQVAVGKYKGVINATLKGDTRGGKGDIRGTKRVAPMSPEPLVTVREPDVVIPENEHERLRLA